MSNTTQPTSKHSSSLFSDTKGFSDAAGEQQDEYRSVSRTALFALVLGCISPLALVHPASWAIPWAGVFVGWQALRSIGRPNSTVSGKTVAGIGLVLCVLFGSWAPAKHLLEQRLLANQARQFTETWFQLARDGHFEEAHRWMLAPHQRNDSMPTQEFYEANVHLQEDLKIEFESEPTHTIVTQPNSSIRFVGFDSIQPIPGEPNDLGILLDFVLESSGSQREDLPFIARVRRKVVDGNTIWQLSSLHEISLTTYPGGR